MEKYAIRAVLEPESETKYKQMQQDLLKKEKELLYSHLRDFKEQAQEQYYNFSKEIGKDKGVWLSKDTVNWTVVIILLGYMLILFILQL